MPSINIENGKRIEDLLEINNFTTSAHFLVSEHNLTRKTTSCVYLKVTEQDA